jgi:hypothetical protein
MHCILAKWFVKPFIKNRISIGLYRDLTVHQARQQKGSAGNPALTQAIRWITSNGKERSGGKGGFPMFLTSTQLKKTIAWLMNNATPPVRYLTGRYLLKMPAGSKVLSSLRREVETFKDTEEIFAKQKDDGSWCSGGSWAMKPSYQQKSKKGGYDPESPKYVTAIWVLPLLGDMGYTAGDARIRKACEYILSYEALPSYYRIFNDPSLSPDYGKSGICGRFFQRLAAFGKVDFTDDRRVKRGYAAIVSAQREDGGWASQNCVDKNHWTRCCPFSSYHAALALYSSRKKEYEKSLIKALEFLVWHLSTKKPEEIRRFFYHGHSTIHELLMFAELKVGWESKPVRVMQEWLKEMHRSDEGCFQYDGKPVSQYSRHDDGMDARVAKYRLYHLIEDDWLTYHAARIAAAAGA